MTDWREQCAELEGLLTKLHEYVHSDARFLLDEDSGAGVYGVELDISIDESLTRTRAELAKPYSDPAEERRLGYLKGLEDCAHAALAQPEPEGMPDHLNLICFAFERQPWATWLLRGGCLESAHCELSDLMLAVLARWGRPAIEPVPVADRPWEREGWCDTEGNLWAEHISRGGTASWRYANRDFLGGWCERCLPHYALPMPTSEPEVKP